MTPLPNFPPPNNLFLCSTTHEVVGGSGGFTFVYQHHAAGAGSVQNDEVVDDAVDGYCTAPLASMFSSGIHTSHIVTQLATIIPRLHRMGAAVACVHDADSALH